MKLSTLILIAAFLAVPLMLAAQFRWLRAPPAEFRRKRRRLFWLAALLFPLLALAHCEATRMEAPPPDPVWPTTWPEARDPNLPPPPPPPSPPPPVERAEDCPPGTRFRASLCIDAENRVVPATPAAPIEE